MVTLILTTMNEVEGLKWVWPRLQIELFSEVIVVDNHSTDGTLEFLSDKPCKIITQSVPGRGNGIREAMQYVRDDAVLIMSTDGNDDPAYIPALIESFRNGYDLVFGTRFADGGATDDSDDSYGLRRAGNRLLTSLVNAIFGASYTDSTYGFRIFKKEAWDVMRIDSKWNETEYMMSIRAAKKKLKVAQIPLVEGRRVGGEVKAKTFATGLSHLRLLFRELV